MWQRFTEAARRVVFYAQEESQHYGEGYVSTEHLLLGLCREQGTTAAKVIFNLGLSLESIKAEVQQHLPRGAARPSQDMTLTPRAKRVIDLAYDEAKSFSDGFIGTEHLLLGLIAEADGLAARVLVKLGLDLAKTRKETAIIRERQGNPVGVGSKGGAELLVSAEDESAFRERMGYRALLIRQGVCKAEFLTLLMLFESSSQKMIERLEISPNEIRAAMERKIVSALSLSDLAPEFEMQSVLNVANKEATSLGHALAPVHILLALFQIEETELSIFLRLKNVSLERMRAAAAG